MAVRELLDYEAQSFGFSDAKHALRYTLHILPGVLAVFAVSYAALWLALAVLG